MLRNLSVPVFTNSSNDFPSLELKPLWSIDADEVDFRFTDVAFHISHEEEVASAGVFNAFLKFRFAD